MLAPVASEHGLKVEPLSFLVSTLGWDLATAQKYQVSEGSMKTGDGQRVGGPSKANEGTTQTSFADGSGR